MTRYLAALIAGLAQILTSAFLLFVWLKTDNIVVLLVSVFFLGVGALFLALSTLEISSPSRIEPHEK